MQQLVVPPRAAAYAARGVIGAIRHLVVTKAFEANILLHDVHAMAHPIPPLLHLLLSKFATRA